MATVTASTKRPASVSSGKRGAPATHVASLKCTPLDPAGSEIRERYLLNGPEIILQTFVDNGVDIRYGDTLVVAGAEYPIKVAENWTWRGTSFLMLLVEQLNP